MERIILLRFGELFLKGGNRPFFERALIGNIKTALDGHEYEFEATRGRYIVSNYDPARERAIADSLADVIGLHSLSIAFKIKTDLDALLEAALALSPEIGAFRCTCHRADKTFPLNSQEFVREEGAYILSKKPALKVDLHTPQVEIFTDIRDDGTSFVYDNERILLGGLPVGTAGRGLVLLSGGIDSPVAAFQMAKRGLKPVYLHFHSHPYTSAAAREKVISLARALRRFTGAAELHLASFTEIQETLRKACAENYSVVLLRRMMIRMANRVAAKAGCLALVTGESLGQVASQTAESIAVTDAVAAPPVLRPLIGSDKGEIIAAARRIGTYDISVLPYEDCCTVFLPKNPVIRPTAERAEEEEGKLDVEGLLNRVQIEKIIV
ncbi:MAG: tRNA 4-thiouridine(8) synthase ThiI [Clostridiales bacterium]|jgi:thiamine biosynthesis protein ThiI|nr:tRNA 4-thiouridine(8) synthase ThiI [Clostridiales bacterium]